MLCISSIKCGTCVGDVGFGKNRQRITYDLDNINSVTDDNILTIYEK